MYDLIKNPNTNRYVSIHSNLGRSVLRNYLYTFQIGGGTLTKVKEATVATAKATAKATVATVKAAKLPVKPSITKVSTALTRFKDETKEMAKNLPLIDLMTKLSTTYTGLKEDTLLHQNDKIVFISDTNEKLWKKSSHLFMAACVISLIINYSALEMWKEGFIYINKNSFDLTFSHRIIRKHDNNQVLKIIAMYYLLRELLYLFATIRDSITKYKEHATHRITVLQKNLDSSLNENYNEDMMKKIEKENIKDIKEIIINQRMIIELDRALELIKSLPIFDVETNENLATINDLHDSEKDDDKKIRSLIKSVHGVQPFTAKFEEKVMIRQTRVKN